MPVGVEDPVLALERVGDRVDGDVRVVEAAAPVAAVVVVVGVPRVDVGVDERAVGPDVVAVAPEVGGGQVRERIVRVQEPDQPPNVEPEVVAGDERRPQPIGRGVAAARRGDAELLLVSEDPGAEGGLLLLQIVVLEQRLAARRVQEDLAHLERALEEGAHPVGQPIPGPERQHHELGAAAAPERPPAPCGDPRRRVLGPQRRGGRDVDALVERAEHRERPGRVALARELAAEDRHAEVVLRQALVHPAGDHGVLAGLARDELARGQHAVEAGRPLGEGRARGRGNPQGALAGDDRAGEGEQRDRQERDASQDHLSTPPLPRSLRDGRPETP